MGISEDLVSHGHSLWTLPKEVVKYRYPEDHKRFEDKDQGDVRHGI